jgi:pilus assembly protein CpaE
VTFVGEVPCCPQHAPLLSAVATASTPKRVQSKHPTVPIPIQPEPGKGARNCVVADCLNPDLWPCSYRDQDGRECGTWLCGDHVEFVGQNRFCHRHAGLVGSLAGACTVPDCLAKEVWVCSYRDRHGQECGTAWCREHVRFVGAVPFCEEHAGLIGTLSVHHGSVREIKTLPTFDDRCASLAEFISEEVSQEILAILHWRYGNQPEVQIMCDERVRDMWYQTQLVWWRTWGALTNAGYLTRIAIWIPMVSAPVTPTVHLLVDSNVVFKQVPDWIIREQRGEPPNPSDLPNFTARIVQSVREFIDMPAPYLVAGRTTQEPMTPAGVLATVRPPPPPGPPPGFATTQEAPAGAAGQPLEAAALPGYAPSTPPVAPPGPAAFEWPAAAGAKTGAEPQAPAPPPTAELEPVAAVPAVARVMLVVESQTVADAVRRLADQVAGLEVVGLVLDPIQALDEAIRLRPQLTLNHLDLSSAAALWVTEQISSRLPDVPVLLVTEDGSSAVLRRAHQAGARDVLVWPYTAADLGAAVRRLLPDLIWDGVVVQEAAGSVAPAGAAIATETAATTKLPDLPLPPMPPPPPVPTADGPAVAATTEQGQITVVFSGKGGVGKSLIATNLASAIAAVSGSEVGLVDLDLQFGDLGLLLNVRPNTSMSNVVEGYPDLDPGYLRSLMAAGPGGVRLLAAPPSPELADLVAPEHVRALLQGLRGIFHNLVVDLGAHLDDRSLEAVQVADQILLVTDLELSTIKNARLALTLFDRLGVSPARVFVVLNRADAKTPVTPDQVEQNLKHPVAAQIPTDTVMVQESVRQATPLVLLHPQAALSRAVRDLVGQIGIKPVAG